MARPHEPSTGPPSSGPPLGPTYVRRSMSPSECWLQQLFDSKAARFGQVIRRSSADVERQVGWPRFRHELERRGFHAVENAGQVVVFCNDEAIRVIR